MLTLVEIGLEVTNNWTPNYSVEFEQDGKMLIVNCETFDSENKKVLTEAARVTDTLKVTSSDEDAVQQLEYYIFR